MVAGATATSAGLLFVALSINRQKVAAPGNEELLRLAKRSFGDYLYALFISLMFLVPAYHAYVFVIPLSCVAFFKAIGLIKAVVRFKANSNETAPVGRLAREFGIQALTFLGVIFVIIEIGQGHVAATYIVVPVISLLLYNATANAWLLLILEGRPETKIAPPSTYNETTLR